MKLTPDLKTLQEMLSSIKKNYIPVEMSRGEVKRWDYFN